MTVKRAAGVFLPLESAQALHDYLAGVEEYLLDRPAREVQGLLQDARTFRQHLLAAPPVPRAPKPPTSEA